MNGGETKTRDLKEALHAYEKEILLTVLHENCYNISKSARVLGISRQNLQHKIKRHHIAVAHGSAGGAQG